MNLRNNSYRDGNKKSKKPKVECDVSANFDISSLIENGSSVSTGESDSDFEMEYTVM